MLLWESEIESCIGAFVQGPQDLMRSAIARARGEKVLDDPKLLRK